MDVPGLDGALYGEPLASDGRVFVATENDTVYALSAPTAPSTGHRTLRHLSVDLAPLR